MRCACCHRKINPANAVAHTDVVRRNGWSMSTTSHYGPVCAQRLGFVAPAPKRKPGNFSIFGPRTAVRVDDGQSDLFGVAA